MSIELLWVALLLGLSGSTHCLSMCGGIAMSMSSTTSGHSHLTWFYSFGRLLSYAILGGLAGYLGSLVAFEGDSRAWLRSLSAVFVILMGIYLLGQKQVLIWLEKLGGASVWRWVQPLAAKCLPIDSIPKATAAGALWGLLPCGLVYSAVTWSLAQASAVNGALLMAAFALGTFPAMVGLSYLPKLAAFLKRSPVRVVLALIVISYGVFALVTAQQMLWQTDSPAHLHHH